MKVVIDIIGCIEKNILMEKMAFLMMLNVCFDEGQISWNNIFFSQVRRNFFYYNNLL